MAEIEMPKLDPKDYPSNTDSKIESSKKVVEGGVTKHKKSLGSKFGETFLSADFGSVVASCMDEVVVPAIKNLLYDTFIGGLEMALWGELNYRGSKSRNGGTYIDYSSRKSSRREERKLERRTAKPRKIVDDIFFDTKSDAYRVLDNLCSAIERYHEVSIADLNDLIGEPGEFTDNKYGWDSLATADIKRYREGYLLVLPPVIPLEE